MRSGERNPTLARRLAWTLALSATIAAAIATMTAMLLADALIRSRVESSVRAAARVMQVEIDEAPDVAGHVEAEARVLGIDGRVAIVREGRVVGGDPTVHADHTDGCRIAEALDCAEPLATHSGAAVHVAVPIDRLYGHRRAFGLAAGGVLVVVMGLAAALGVAMSRRFLAPLHRLHRAVVDVDASAPAAVELPAPAGLEEIDALRGALVNLLARLDAELGRARRFASSAAHELRTPLAKMRAEIELARESLPRGGAGADALARLERTTERLAALTQRLLLLATPHDALATEQGASMTQVVEDLGERMDVARIRIDACDGDAWVRGDELLLASMLDNVVDNALKFSAGIVGIAVREEDGQVVVDVDDDGAGVPDGAADLFAPFRRGAASLGLPGHGLGLALVAHIASAYGGTATFEPRSAGARLRIRLPLHRSASYSYASSNSVPDTISPTPSA